MCVACGTAPRVEDWELKKLQELEDLENVIEEAGWSHVRSRIEWGSPNTPLYLKILVTDADCGLAICEIRATAPTGVVALFEGVSEKGEDAVVREWIAVYFQDL